jgi:hypothetical protein
VNYRANGRAPASEVGAQMNPRSDGIVIGNLQDRGNYSLEPDPDVIRRNVQAAIDFFLLMRPAKPSVRLTRSDPPSRVPGVESFFNTED